jgi:hypothetical protein
VIGKPLPRRTQRPQRDSEYLTRLQPPDLTWCSGPQGNRRDRENLYRGERRGRREIGFRIFQIPAIPAITRDSGDYARSRRSSGTITGYARSRRSSGTITGADGSSGLPASAGMGTSRSSFRYTRLLALKVASLKPWPWVMASVGQASTQ